MKKIGKLSCFNSLFFLHFFLNIWSLLSYTSCLISFNRLVLDSYVIYYAYISLFQIFNSLDIRLFDLMPVLPSTQNNIYLFLFNNTLFLFLEADKNTLNYYLKTYALILAIIHSLWKKLCICSHLKI